LEQQELSLGTLRQVRPSLLLSTNPDPARPFVHAPQSIVFDAASFSRLSDSQGDLGPGPGFESRFVEDIYFVTRDGIGFDNLSSKESNLIVHRLASDPDFDDDLSDENALNSLRLSLTRPAQELTTSDVIRLLDRLRLPNQILLLTTRG
jgi:hypothetical protein